MLPITIGTYISDTANNKYINPYLAFGSPVYQVHRVLYDVYVGKQVYPATPTPQHINIPFVEIDKRYEANPDAWIWITREDEYLRVCDMKPSHFYNSYRWVANWFEKAMNLYSPVDNFGDYSGQIAKIEFWLHKFNLLLLEVEHGTQKLPFPYSTHEIKYCLEELKIYHDEFEAEQYQLAYNLAFNDPFGILEKHHGHELW